METDELAQYLNALHREDCYRVDAVLKTSAYETTQRVYFVGANGSESGPYIRKFIARESGMGSAYERIFAAQKAGKRFRHIPHVLECYQHDEQLAVVMEFVQGETLQDYVYRNDPSSELAFDVFPTLCDAVSELHDDFSPAIIHRDLKPSNIIMSDGNLTIIDFGISREFKDDADADTAQFGTRAFAPPEQFGFGQTTVRSDVYALGMLLYFCLTERIPDNSVRESGFDEPELTPEMRAVIRRATQFDPERRYESARLLKAAFLAAYAQMESKSRRAVTPEAPRAAVPDDFDAANAAVGGTAHDEAEEMWEDETPDDDRPPADDAPSLLGTIWNIIVLICLAIVLGASIGLAFNPSESTAHYPTWVNYVGYLFMIPLISIGGAWLVMYKRRIMQRFPTLQRFRTSRWVLIYIGILIVMFVIAGIMGMAIGA